MLNSTEQLNPRRNQSTATVGGKSNLKGQDLVSTKSNAQSNTNGTSNLI